MRRSLPYLLLVLSGCSAQHPPRDTSPIPVPAQAHVAPDRILVQFQTLGCGCQLGSVEFELLQLPGVGMIEWELNQSRLWMIFLDDRRPTDDAIERAIADFDVVVASIKRP